MRKKSLSNLFFLNAAAVICNSYKINTAAFDFYGNCCRVGIYSIFHKLFYNRGRSFNNFSGSNLINRTLVKNSYLWHNFSLLTFLSFLYYSITFYFYDLNAFIIIDISLCLY